MLGWQRWLTITAWAAQKEQQSILRAQGAKVVPSPGRPLGRGWCPSRAVLYLLARACWLPLCGGQNPEKAADLPSPGAGLMPALGQGSWSCHLSPSPMQGACCLPVVTEGPWLSWHSSQKGPWVAVRGHSGRSLHHED